MKIIKCQDGLRVMAPSVENYYAEVRDPKGCRGAGVVIRMVTGHDPVAVCSIDGQRDGEAAAVEIANAVLAEMDDYLGVNAKGVVVFDAKKEVGRAIERQKVSAATDVNCPNATKAQVIA